MKTELKPVYECDFCKIKKLHKGSMTRHEKQCKSNPKNAHKCFEFCKNLERETITTDYEGCYVEFTCKKRPDVQLYSFKLEKDWRGQKRIKETKIERMPLECDLFEEMFFDIISGSYTNSKP